MNDEEYSYDEDDAPEDNSEIGEAKGVASERTEPLLVERPPLTVRDQDPGPGTVRRSRVDGMVVVGHQSSIPRRC